MNSTLEIHNFISFRGLETFVFILFAAGILYFFMALLGLRHRHSREGKSFAALMFAVGRESQVWVGVKRNGEGNSR